MRIAVSSMGPEPSSPISEQFGRAPYFLVYDDATGAWETITNTAANGAGGVGPQAVQFLVNARANAVITGRAGGNAIRSLEAAGIRAIYHTTGGSVEAALNANKGALSSA